MDMYAPLLRANLLYVPRPTLGCSHFSRGRSCRALRPRSAQNEILAVAVGPTQSFSCIAATEPLGDRRSKRLFLSLCKRTHSYKGSNMPKEIESRGGGTIHDAGDLRVDEDTTLEVDAA